MVIDLDRLDANAQLLSQLQRPDLALRLVQKSLPSMDLLNYIATRLETHRLMVFHRPWLNHHVRQDRWRDILLGKPMPVAAARSFYRTLAASSVPAELGNTVQWLIDTLERLQHYLDMARALPEALRRNPLRICIEINVGLHRGGVPTPEVLGPMLRLIGQHPQHLKFTGFMGYDAHVVKAPWWTSPEQEMREVQERYRAFVNFAWLNYPDLCDRDLVFNGGGSPTALLHGQGSPLNDLAVGSALLKPTDFDLPSLAMFSPALLLAVPVLKAGHELNLPFVSPVSRWLGHRLPRFAQSIALYGGRHLAQPVWPPGMHPMPLMGRSSNQQMMVLGAKPMLKADDWTFWRPTQSEHTLLQHGDMLGMRGDDIVCSFAMDPSTLATPLV